MSRLIIYLFTYLYSLKLHGQCTLMDISVNLIFSGGPWAGVMTATKDT